MSAMSERPNMHQVPNTDTGGDVSSGGIAPAREPSHAERCRTLVASASRGALSTLTADPQGYPYGSVASYAIDERGDPLFFVSLMAEHTQNAIRDPRASLLVTEPVPDGADPLASGRATLIGDLVSKGNYGSAMGVFGSLWDTGHALGPIIFGFLLVALGYQTSWLIMAAIMAAALAVFLFGTRRQPGTASPS